MGQSGVSALTVALLLLVCEPTLAATSQQPEIPNKVAELVRHPSIRGVLESVMNSKPMKFIRSPHMMSLLRNAASSTSDQTREHKRQHPGLDDQVLLQGPGEDWHKPFFWEYSRKYDHDGTVKGDRNANLPVAYHEITKQPLKDAFEEALDMMLWTAVRIVILLVIQDYFNVELCHERQQTLGMYRASAQGHLLTDRLFEKAYTEILKQFHPPEEAELSLWTPAKNQDVVTREDDQPDTKNVNTDANLERDTEPGALPSRQAAMRLGHPLAPRHSLVAMLETAEGKSDDPDAKSTEDPKDDANADEQSLASVRRAQRRGKAAAIPERHTGFSSKPETWGDKDYALKRWCSGGLRTIFTIFIAAGILVYGLAFLSSLGMLVCAFVDQKVEKDLGFCVEPSIPWVLPGLYVRKPSILDADG